MRKILPAALGGLLGVQGMAAADLEVKVGIPRLAVAEYHRPYVALWIEKPDQSLAANLAVWYDQQTSKQEKGATWLKDLRQWWRKIGRELELPADGVTGATRPPGVHAVTFRGGSKPLASLAPGAYQLVVEAAREVGGREIVRIPFQWPAGGAAKADGQHELGPVELTIKR